MIKGSVLGALRTNIPRDSAAFSRTSCTSAGEKTPEDMAVFMGTKRGNIMENHGKSWNNHRNMMGNHGTHQGKSWKILTMLDLQENIPFTLKWANYSSTVMPKFKPQQGNHGTESMSFVLTSNFEICFQFKRLLCFKHLLTPVHKNMHLKPVQCVFSFILPVYSILITCLFRNFILQYSQHEGFHK